MAVATTAPGTRFYAPQARLVDANTNQVVGQTTTPGSTPNPADLDLVSAKVTLLINNVCQLQVVLDNQRNKGGLPVFPPWKYNSLAQIHFGQRLRLDVRYGGDPWQKMILARVTDLQFGFPSSGAAQLTIVGEDMLSVLKTKDEHDKRYAERTEDFLIRDVLTRSKAKDLGLEFTGTEPKDDPLKGPLVGWPELAPLTSITQSKDTTYLQFLQNIAERMDFELFVDFSERLLLDSQAPPKDANKVMLHFEPARSVVTPDKAIDLRWGTNLVDFTPKFKVWEQLTGVKVAGTKHGTRKRHTETIHVDDAVIRQDLKQDLEYKLPGASSGEAVDLLDAGQARAHFFGKEGTVPKNNPSISTSNLDSARTRLQGIATLRKSLRELLTAEGSTFGFPDLRPGVYVRIGGLYPPFDGLYYVTQTVHSFDTNGYRTQFSLRRPGMLDPSRYPAEEEKRST
jgi:phage protein D